MGQQKISDMHIIRSNWMKEKEKHKSDGSSKEQIVSCYV